MVAEVSPLAGKPVDPSMLPPSLPPSAGGYPTATEGPLQWTVKANRQIAAGESQRQRDELKVARS